MAEAVVASEWAEPISLDRDYLFNPIGFDHPGVETSFLLDTSYLSQVLSVFGGVAHTEAVFEGTEMTWACYDAGSARTTFISLRTGEGDDTIDPPVPAGPVVSVIVEEANAPANPACTDNPAAAAPRPGNDIPRLGATAADLVSRFGGSPPGRADALAYVSRSEQGDEESWIERKVVYYRIEDGIVTGVAYLLTSER